MAQVPDFVHSLVDSAAQIVETIWPLAAPAAHLRCTLPLRAYIEQTLRCSRTSFHTLQVALYYLILLRPHLPTHDFTMEQPVDSQPVRALQCGRRMFLAALMIASKFLQDRNYSARLWSRWTSLKAREVTDNERAFLSTVDYKLHMAEALYERWQDLVRMQSAPSPKAATGSVASWCYLIPRLQSNLTLAVPTPTCPLSIAADAKPMPKSKVRAQRPPAINTRTETPLAPLPRVLEPRLDVAPVARFDSVPTPCSQGSQIPPPALQRVGTLPSIGLEMYHFAGRPTTAGSAPVIVATSSTSSPESLLTEHSSSSRTSSVSSLTSSCPSQAQLTRQATCRSAQLLNLALHTSPQELPPIDEACAVVHSHQGVHDSAVCLLLPDSKPGTNGATSTTHKASTSQADRPLQLSHADAPAEPLLWQDFTSCTKLTSRSCGAQSKTVATSPRKRSRSPAEQRHLQDDVRQLLHAHVLPSHPSSRRRARSKQLDEAVAASIAAARPFSFDPFRPLGLQPSCGTDPAPRVPVQKELGKKRSCCSMRATEPAALRACR